MHQVSLLHEYEAVTRNWSYKSCFLCIKSVWWRAPHRAQRAWRTSNSRCRGTHLQSPWGDSNIHIHGSVGDVIFNMALALPWVECISRWLLYCNHTHIPPNVRRPRWRAVGEEREDKEMERGWRKERREGKRSQERGRVGQNVVETSDSADLSSIWLWPSRDGERWWCRGSCRMLRSWTVVWCVCVCVETAR